MSVAIKELEVQEQARTFKQATPGLPQKEYHFMLRTVGPMALPDGTITVDMLDADVMVWLNSGFTLLAVHLVTTNKGAGGEYLGNVFGYHFVKE